jgi:[DsrC]-trisulfide reductase subunit J
MRGAGERGGGGKQRTMRAIALVALTGMTFAAAGGDASRVPGPPRAIPADAGAKCVEDTPTMRRSHMEFLKHHRDRTVHEGIRTTQHSLANCVDCHASRETGRVTGSRDAFCEGCHAFAAVKLDCFECHSDRARKVAEAAPK